MICSSCHSENSRESIYCSHCGVRLRQTTSPGPSSSTEFHGERRQLTALFCDVVDSTAMAAALDPEEYHDIIRAFAGRCREVVESFGGYVAELQGDGALIFFGYPRSHGDEAERAVRAGIGIIKNFEELAIVGDRKLRLRIGIATGIMAINVSASKKTTIVGDAVNLAARLQTLGEPNSIVISELTKRLAGSFFDFLDLGALPLKGFPRPVPAWRVVGNKNVPSRFEALRLSVLAGFVGRDRELRLIRDCWDRVKDGKGQIVTISGEPGIGKSRLIKQARDGFGEDVLAVQCSCSPYHMTTALHPVVEYVTRVAGFDLEQTTSGRRRSLETLVSRTGSNYEIHLPWLASLMSLPDETIPHSLSPQQRRQNTLRAILWCLNELARKAPFLLILEDAHWVDPTSSELMEMIVDRIKTLPILMIVSFRQPFRRSWMNDGHVAAIPLERLNRTEASALVSDLASKKALAPELSERIIEKSDGIPLYVEELTKMVLNSEASGDKVTLQPSVNSLAGSELPTTLQDLLMARLDQLSPAKQVAQIASVIGREFSFDLLSAIEDLPTKSLQGSLDQLIEAGLISRQSAASFQTFTFKHAMVRDAAYESLLKRDRRQLHAKVASVLERKHTAQPDIAPELLAHHYTQAGLIDQALTYWASAAQRALLRSANAEVIGHTEKALEILTGLPESRDRHRQELIFRFLAGGAYWAYKGYGSKEVEETFTRAQELAAEIGDAAQTVYALRGLFGCYYVRAEPERAQKQAERVIKLARESHDRGDLMVGHMMLGSILFWRAEFETARHELEKAISLYDVAEQRTKMLSMQVDPGINAHMHLGANLWMLGSPDVARQVSDQAVALARQMEQPFALAQALFFNCMVKWWRGEIAAAEVAVSELKTVATDYEITFLVATVPLLEGGLLIAAGKADLGLERIRQAFTEFQAQQASLGKPLMMAVMATGFFHAGMTDEAMNTLARGISAAEISGELQWLAELHRLKGEFLASLPVPRMAEAKASIRQAIDIAVRQGALSLELRAAITLCRISKSKAELDEAVNRLKSVYSRFTEGFDTANLHEAKKLLEELGATSKAKPELVAAAGPHRGKKRPSRAK
jgi:class 3 adenylate cyclase/tetratricopeptide (TPR) repeat protein